MRAIVNQVPKFRPNRSTRGGVMTLYTISRWRLRGLHTTSGLEKQTSAKFEFSFRLLLRPYHSNWSAVPHQATTFRPNRATCGGVMTSYTISRWRHACRLIRDYCFMLLLTIMFFYLNKCMMAMMMMMMMMMTGVTESRPFCHVR